MTWWHRLWRRGKLEEQLRKELQFHIDRHTADLIAQGHLPGEARRQARLALGGPELVKENCRDARGTRWLEDLWQDAAYAVRILRQKPGFTAVSVLTLALGIGATTAIFSAVNPILFEPLPYPQAARITMIWDRGDGGQRSDITFGTYREVAERSRSFEAIAAMKSWQPAMTGSAEPERLDGQRVSAGYFQVLGVRPAIGQDFDASDDRPHGSNVAILSDGLWRSRFGADRTIVGRPITLDGDPYTVIGVMPRTFENVLAPTAELWSLLQYDRTLPAQGREWGHHLRMVSRLRPGLAVDPAGRELDLIAHAPVREFSRPPWASLKQGLIVNGLQDDVTRGVRPALLAVLGAVILVLAIACVNVTNLLLARGAQRRGEFAMRAALGAGRTRLARQLLTESLLGAALGGVLGIAVAELGVGILVALSPPELPRLGAIGLNRAVFGFGAVVTTLIGLTVGLIPALQTSRAGLHGGLQQASRRTAGSHRFTRNALVIAEVALALVLLVSSTLLLRSFQRLFAVAPGFDSSHVLTMQVQTSGHRFDQDLTGRFFADALEAVRRVPGVTSAGFTSLLPLSGELYGEYGIRFESTALNQQEPAYRYAVTPGYLETLAIPLRRGRLLDAYDAAAASPVVLINESFARRKFPGQDPIGGRVHIGPESLPWAGIVGVVGDVKQASLALGTPDAFYLPAASKGWFADSAMSLVVRTRGNAAALAPAVKKAIWSVDKDQPIVRVIAMDRLVAASQADRRFVLILFQAFALAALALAAIGIYGVLSGSVTERMREIGVRSALGASRGDIMALVVRQGMALTALGAAIGLAGAVAASRALVTLLFGISRLDPITYIGVIVLLAVVSAIACWMPAWRAARVDPALTLRAE